MGIKRKKDGPRPNAPNFGLEWQNIAYTGERMRAVRSFRSKFQNAGLVEAVRAVNAFQQKHKIKPKD